MIYVITHGDRFVCANPEMTSKGFAQIRSLASFLPQKIARIFVGTGKRFQQIYELLFATCSVPVVYSCFCGGADALGTGADGRKTVITGIGIEVGYPDEYIGVSNCDAFDAWKFLVDMPDQSVVCSGRPIMYALGFRESKMGSLYEIDPLQRTIQCIKEGEPQ